MDTTKIRRFLERHAYSIPATDGAEDMLRTLDEVDEAVKEAREDVADFAALMADQRAHLRDTFAAAALTGILANARTTADGAEWSTFGEATAKIAFVVADAMLAAREGK